MYMPSNLLSIDLGLFLTALGLLVTICFQLRSNCKDRPKAALQAFVHRRRNNDSFCHEDFVLNLELVNTGRLSAYVGSPRFHRRNRRCRMPEDCYIVDAAGDFPSQEESPVEAPHNKPLRATFTLDWFVMLRKEQNLDVSEMVISIPFNGKWVRTRLSSGDQKLLERLTDPARQRIYVADGTPQPPPPGEIGYIFVPVKPSTQAMPGFPEPNE